MKTSHATFHVWLPIADKIWRLPPRASNYFPYSVAGPENMQSRGGGLPRGEAEWESSPRG